MSREHRLRLVRARGIPPTMRLTGRWVPLKRFKTKVEGRFIYFYSFAIFDCDAHNSWFFVIKYDTLFEIKISILTLHINFLEVYLVELSK